MDTIAPVYGWLHIRVDILDNPDQDLGFGLAVLFFLPLTCFYYLYYLYYLLFVQLKPFQAFFSSHSSHCPECIIMVSIHDVIPLFPKGKV